MNGQYKIAVVGCGKISVNHFRAIEQLTNATLYTVCDIDRELADKAKLERGAVMAYYDYEAVLGDPLVDSIHLCVPHHLHAKMSIAGLLSGKHVLCEKPMSLSTVEAELIQKAHQQSGKNYGVCFQNRYNAASQAIKKLLESGELGEILGGRGQVVWNRGASYYAGSPWKGTWNREGGGVLINQAIHTFDLLQWFAGRMETLEASISRKCQQPPVEVEDTVDVVMTNKKGARFLFYASNCYVTNAPVEIEIVCERGSIHMIKDHVLVIKNGERREFDYSSGITYGLDYWGSGHGYLIEDFYQSLETGKDFYINSLEAMASVTLVEAVYHSAKANTKLHLY